MQDIKELYLEQLKTILEEWKYPSFHAEQIFSWIYKKNVLDFNQMSNLSQNLKDALMKNFKIFSFNTKEVLNSNDGTKKILFELEDKNLIEAVIINASNELGKERVTGCISSQVGCKFSCKFCASGLAGFKRNLTTSEIIEEILLLKRNSLDNKLTNLVFMGTGEPLDNYDNVIKAIKIINSSYSLNIGARKITISTCGIVPAIKKLSGVNLQIELSVSLHSVDDIIRTKLMPINKLYPVKELLKACRQYIEKTNRQITFEYVLIDKINSGSQNADKLIKMLKGMNCKINIIPFNSVENLDFKQPKKEEILSFKDYLEKSGLHATIRQSRGNDVNGACGQLKIKYET